MMKFILAAVCVALAATIANAACNVQSPSCYNTSYTHATSPVFDSSASASFFTNAGFQLTWKVPLEYSTANFKYFPTSKSGSSDVINQPAGGSVCDYAMYSGCATPGADSEYTETQAVPECINTVTALYTLNGDSAANNKINAVFNNASGQAPCFAPYTESSLAITYKTTVQITTVKNGAPDDRGHTPIYTWVTTKPITITFPKLVNVTTTVTAVGSVSIQGDFRLQRFVPNPATPNTGTLQLFFFTSVQFPYVIDVDRATIDSSTLFNLSTTSTLLSLVPAVYASGSVTAGLADTFLSGQITESYPCLNGTGSDNPVCWQLWRTTLNVADCTFSGSLVLKFGVKESSDPTACRTPYTGPCTVTEDQRYKSFTLTIQSNDVCKATIADVQVDTANSNLNSYSTATARDAAGATNTQFVFGSTAYFRARITAPQLTKTSVNRVVVASFGTVVLPSGSVPSYVPRDSNYVTAWSATANQRDCGFEFVVDSNTFSTAGGQAANDAATTLTITAEISLVFANLAERTVLLTWNPSIVPTLQATTGTTELSAQIAVSNGNSAASSGANGTGIPVLVGAIVGGVFLLGGMIGLVAYRIAAARRRSQSERQLVDAPLPKISDA